MMLLLQRNQDVEARIFKSEKFTSWDFCTDGIYSYLSNLLGANFLMNRLSKFSLFVSCKQMIEHVLSSIFFLIASHFSSPLIPLMFQHRIFHSLCRVFID